MGSICGLSTTHSLLGILNMLELILLVARNGITEYELVKADGWAEDISGTSCAFERVQRALRGAK